MIMPQTYRVTAYITQRVETLVVTDDEDMVSELALENLSEGDYSVQKIDADVLEYELIHDANIN